MTNVSHRRKISRRQLRECENKDVSAERRMDVLYPIKTKIRFCKPRLEETTTNNRLVWNTLCRRYKIVRSNPKYDGLKEGFVPMRRRKIEHQLNGQGVPQKNIVEFWDGLKVETDGSPKCYKTLDMALDLIIQYHLERFKVKDLDCNDEALLAHAHRNGLDRLASTVVVPSPKSAPPSNGGQQENGGGKRAKLFGCSIVAIIRWMAVNNFSALQARKVLKAEGIAVSDTTINIQLNAGKKGKAPPADLTNEQSKQLRRHLL